MSPAPRDPVPKVHSVHPLSLQEISKIMGIAARRWFAADARQLSAAIAFNAIMSLAPLLLILLTVASKLLGSDAAQDFMLSTVSREMGDEAMGIARSLIEIIVNARGGAVATVVGVVITGFYSSSAFLQLRTALSRIWGVPPRATIRGVVLEHAHSFVMFSVAVAAIGLTLVLGFVGSIAGPAMDEIMPRGATVWRFLSGVASFAILALLLAYLFRQVPGIEVEWDDVWVGAVLASLIFNIGNFLIGHFIGSNLLASLYGAAGTLVVALLWVFYGTQMLLYGASFTSVYAERHGSRRPEVAASKLQSEEEPGKSA